MHDKTVYDPLFYTESYDTNSIVHLVIRIIETTTRNLKFSSRPAVPCITYFHHGANRDKAKPEQIEASGCSYIDYQRNPYIRGLHLYRHRVIYTLCAKLVHPTCHFSPYIAALASKMYNTEGCSMNEQ